MSLFKNIFAKKDAPIITNHDFWNWFKKNEREFNSVVKNDKDIEKNFFNQLSSKLAELKEGYFYLTGMLDDHTVELIFTADGNVKNIVFVEELVASAPYLTGWKFTALKPSLDIEDVSINMSDLEFNADNLYFYSKNIPNCPDEIAICIIHKDMDDDNKSDIINGSYIFLENYIGELDFVNLIDDISFESLSEAKQELVPISKLKDFLVWRQKEFVEKYQGVRYETENDEHSVLEAKLEDGNSLIAVIDTNLLNWDRKASHPWMAVMKIGFDGGDNNGMPNNEDYDQLDYIQEELIDLLKDYEGYLNVGRQTSQNVREIFFACKEFRLPSKVFYDMQLKYEHMYEMEYYVFKDKYWQMLEQFKQD